MLPLGFQVWGQLNSFDMKSLSTPAFLVLALQKMWVD